MDRGLAPGGGPGPVREGREGASRTSATVLALVPTGADGVAVLFQGGYPASRGPTRSPHPGSGPGPVGIQGKAVNERKPMSTITASVDVNAPIAPVYDQWTQFETFPQFMEGVDRVQQMTPTKTHWDISVAGVRREFDATITEQHPQERVAW